MFLYMVSNFCFIFLQCLHFDLLGLRLEAVPALLELLYLADLLSPLLHSLYGLQHAVLLLLQKVYAIGDRLRVEIDLLLDPLDVEEPRLFTSSLL